MKHVLQYDNPSELSTLINNSLKGTEEVFEHLFSTENIMSEVELLNRAEESIPEELKFNLELDLILKRGKNSSTDYYRGLAEGKNLLVDSLDPNINSPEIKKVNEAMLDFIDSIKFLRKKENKHLLEAATAKISDVTKMGDADMSKMLGNIESTSDLSGITSGVSWTGLLKKLWNAVTEGGSAIGILHLVLDIVGLFGDFFGPIGMVADVLNGIIYMVRGKWVLATISFIAALIPFAGSLFAGVFKAGSKTGAQVLEISAAWGKSNKISKEAVVLAQKASPDSIKAMGYVAKSSKKMLPGLSTFMSKFFSDFLGKLVGWIPLIGKPLKRFFDSIAGMFSKYSTKITKFADDVPEVMAKAATKSIDDFFKATAKEGSEIVVSSSGKGLSVVDSAGKEIVELEARYLKNADVIARRWGGAAGMGDDAFKAIGKNQDSILTFYKSMGTLNKSADNMYGLVNRVGSKVVKAYVVTAQIPMFVGKQIWKAINNWEGMDLSGGEYKAIGNVAISDVMQKIMNKNLKENPDASYSVPYVDAMENEEAQRILQSTLQYNAEKYDMPHIIDVGYYTSKQKDRMPKDVKNFYENIYKDRPEVKKQLDDQMDIGKTFFRSRYESIEFDDILDDISENKLIHVKKF